MSYNVKIISQNEHVEESIWVEINGKILNVFCGDYNFTFKPNGLYQVELEYEIFDEYEVELTEKLPQFIQIDQSFAYEIIGILQDGSLTVDDIVFKDEFLFSEYNYLENSKISLKVDRINLYFNSANLSPILVG